MKDFHQQNYYELLDVEVNANQDDILAAYKRARAAYSGNSPALYTVFTKKEAEEILGLIDEAYSVLSNQFKRKEYNKLHYPHLVPPAPPASAPVPSRLVAKGKPFVAAKAPSAENFIPMKGHRDVSQKKLADDKPAAGSTRFGKYEVNQELETKIDQAESFSGDFLKEIRAYKKVSLDQIADATKIGRPYLEALEASDYSHLPAPVFLKGFLSQYSKILNLDVERVTVSYLRIMRERGQK